MKKLPPLQVKVDRVKPLIYGDSYESRMILDHVITGRDNVIQINHGTVKAHKALGGAAHEEDEIYYILDGKGKLKLDDEIIDIEGNQVIFPPAFSMPSTTAKATPTCTFSPSGETIASTTPMRIA